MTKNVFLQFTKVLPLPSLYAKTINAPTLIPFSKITSYTNMIAVQVSACAFNVFIYISNMVLLNSTIHKNIANRSHGMSF